MTRALLALLAALAVGLGLGLLGAIVVGLLWWTIHYPNPVVGAGVFFAGMGFLGTLFVVAFVALVERDRP